MKKLTPTQLEIASRARSRKPDFYSWEVEYRNPATNHTASVLGGEENAEKAFRRMFHDAQHYRDMGYEITVALGHLVCGACGGSGEIEQPTKKRSQWSPRKTFTCPFCEGQPQIACVLSSVFVAQPDA